MSKAVSTSARGLRAVPPVSGTHSGTAGLRLDVSALCKAVVQEVREPKGGNEIESADFIMIGVIVTIGLIGAGFFAKKKNRD